MAIVERIRSSIGRGRAQRRLAHLRLIATMKWRDHYKRALEDINAVKTWNPPMGFEDYYRKVTDIARAALYCDDLED